MRFDRKKFADSFRKFLARNDKRLTQERVNALEFLLTRFEADNTWSDLRHIAYALATICAETAWTFEPIQEYGTNSYFERRYGYQTKVGRGLGNDAPGEGAKYSGKGYVQLTGESNYEKLEIRLRQKYPQIINDFQRKTGQTFDLTDYVAQAKNPVIAFAIMTVGMFEGIYTSKKLSDYINAKKTDYKNARKIINGLDHAEMIAGYARSIESVLRIALTNEKLIESQETSKQAETEPQPIAPTDSPVETTQIETPTQSTQITQTKNEQDVNIPAEVSEPKPQGIFGKLSAGISTLFGGTAIYTAVEKFGGVSISQTVLILIVVAVILAFLGFLFWAWLDAWKSAQRTKIEAEAKTAIDKKDVKWVKQ